MPSITTERGTIHFEVAGRGDPVVFLHGWLGSCKLWQETMQALSSYYRIYALDFWGFGESGKESGAFAVQDFVSLVGQFLDRLGLGRVPLVGHSMGGTVSLAYAMSHPDRVRKVVLIGSPIQGSSLAVSLKLAGYPCIAGLVFRSLWALKLGIRLASPWITRDRQWPRMIEMDLANTTLESFFLSIASLRQTDLCGQLRPQSFSVMGMYGNRDVIVDPNQWALLSRGLPTARIERFENAGHFIMLDEPGPFQFALRDFLDREQ